MSQSFQFHIGGEAAGLRVDEFLASRFGGLSRMRIASLISAGACLVNQKTAQAGWRVADGDRVELAMDEGAPTAMDPEPVPLEILYEDSHLVIVVKPSGMLVHPTKNTKHGTLANALAYHLNKDFYESSSTGPRPALRIALHGEAHSLVRPGIVHRLDRATSGLMVIAKTPRALSTLSRHFNRRLVKKRYLALVEGVLDEGEGTIKAPIGRDPDGQPHWRVMESGKEAESRFFVRERFERATLLELEPVTGRTNQLRIHCARIGHPIIGDEIYGAVGSEQLAVGSEKTLPAEQNDSGNETPKLSTDAHPLAVNGQLPAANCPPPTASCPPPTANRSLPTARYAIRLCLHAWRLAFHHPANGEWLEFASPLPKDFASFVERLGHTH